MTIVTGSSGDTMAFGRRLGELLEPGDVVALRGTLGSGKTTLTKGIAEGLGVEEPRWVTSPTFVLVHEYRGRIPVYHIDAYRLRSAGDAEAIAIEEMFFGDGVTVVEWAERIAAALPEERLEADLEIVGETLRQITLRPFGPRYERLLAALEAAAGGS